MSVREIWDRLQQARLRRRARKEAKALVREARRALRSYAYKIPDEVRVEVSTGADELEKALAANDHDAICKGLVTLEDQVDRHLSFSRKSTVREYGESIAVAVLIALFLRAFVVEAFKIPSGSMIPTMEVGDHIFVNKFLYGIRIPFTKTKFFDWRSPHRGEVIVFIYPKEPEKDFIKRVIGVAGDTIEVRRNQVYVNGVALKRTPVVENECSYWDYDEHYNQWKEHTCARFQEESDGHKYMTINSTDESWIDFPRPGDESPYKVPEGTVFVMGDNRNNSSDSRSWGPVPLENIKGKALVIWWSSGKPSGIRWNRLAKVVE
jgi:signal peptidase I